MLCCSSAKAGLSQAERLFTEVRDTEALDWQENLNILPPNLELSLPLSCFPPVHCRDKL